MDNKNEEQKRDWREYVYDQLHPIKMEEKENDKTNSKDK